MKNICYVVIVVLVVIAFICVNRIVELDYERNNNCKFETVMTTTDTPERVCVDNKGWEG